MTNNDDKAEQKSERFNMFMSPSEMKAIDDWAWENKIRSKSEAVRRLCQIGLHLDKYMPEILSDMEKIVQVGIETVTALPKPNEPLNDDDALSLVLKAIEQQMTSVNLLEKIAHAYNDIQPLSETVEIEKAIEEHRKYKEETEEFIKRAKARRQN